VLMICFLISVTLHVMAILRQHLAMPFQETVQRTTKESARVVVPRVARSAKRNNDVVPTIARPVDATSPVLASVPAVSQ